MVIVRQEQDLILINAVRLNAENKKRLDRLGQVKHLIRLGDFHGLDDQYYIDHYEATLWSQKNHITYPNLIASQIISSQTQPPIKESEFFIFKAAKYPEAALLLNKEKLLITTDNIQYWDDWKYISLPSRLILFLMSFRLSLFIGSPWLKQVSTHPDALKDDFEQLLNLEFKHMIGAHGNILKDQARQQLKECVSKTFKS